MARPATQPAAVVTSVTFTQSQIVPGRSSGPRAPGRAHRWWAVPLAVLGMFAILAPIVAAVVPSSAVIRVDRCVTRDSKGKCTKSVEKPMEAALVPADAEPVEPRLVVNGATTYPSKGEIYFVTIREPKTTVLDWIAIRSKPAARDMTHQEKFGNQSEQQLLQAGQRQMTGAKDRATYVALKAAGYPVTRKEGPIVVDYTVCLKSNPEGTKCLQEAPASQVLQPDDEITAVNGTPTPTLADLPPVLAKVKAGDLVDISFTRGTKKMTGRVQTVSAQGEATPRTIIGFAPVDTTTVVLPKGLDVEFETEGIGGPSAGTAFTLTLIDQLTPGDLMGPQKVAVTGEIDIDGNVGAIGGLNSKASAVMQVGVKYFLVPASQPATGPDSIAAARKAVGDKVTIIPIATLADALRVLRTLGGDALPPAATPDTATVTTG